MTSYSRDNASLSDGIPIGNRAPACNIGERHDPEIHLIPLVLDAAVGARSAVTVYGDDYDTPDGTCIRDYIHVSDLAEAHVLALRSLQAGGVCAAYNLGNGQGFSVREVIALAQAITGHEIPVVLGSRRPGDPPPLVADASRARQGLGWEPRHASLQGIL